MKIKFAKTIVVANVIRRSSLRNNFFIIVLAMSICFLFGVVSYADNPFVQTIYTADPAPFVYKDVVYAYLDHDEDGTYGWFQMKDWRLFTTTDMVNWTDHGVTANIATFSWGRIDAWAGQVAYRNGKFYYYVPIRLTGEPFGIGVGVSDKPEGPFIDAIGKPLVSGVGYIDPSVFVDDDGQAYLYWGNPSCNMVKLNEDMISYSGSIVKVPMNVSTVNNMYLEGPWFYKRNALYYLLYATQNNGNPGKEDIRYSTSPGPTGPWTYKGLIQPMQVGAKSWTNHSGVIDYKGNSYFFYHNGDLPGGSDFTRSSCVEQFKYNADGTIPSIPMTKSGPPQIGHLNPYDTTQAETICWGVGLKTEKCSEGGMNVDSIHKGDYIKVKGVDFGSGASSFDARVASAANGGSIELHIDTLTGPLVGTCSIQGTGGWQTWTTKSCTVTDATGVHDLYLKFTGGSGRLFNFNWWKFTMAVGIGQKTRAKNTCENLVNVVINEGKIPMIRLDFSQLVPPANVNVCLFDLNGRLESTLFAGRLSARNLSLPLNRAEVCTGVYVVRVVMDNKITFLKTFSLQ
jgi:arabinoxylan arabinofuranohydrolase